MAQDLIESDVILTTSRGLGGEVMAEYTLALVAALAKRLPETLECQAQHRWQMQETERLQGAHALVLGVGSIGRKIARLLSAVGLVVDGMGRRSRDDDSDFRRIYASSELDARLPEYDFVVIIVPSTPATHRMFGAEQFARMKPTARLINLARGSILDESALIEALRTGQIAAAGLDVFEEEPLPPESPLWAMKNVIVSPHISSAYSDYEREVVDLFIDNLDRYRHGRPLLNVIDKAVGFVPGGVG